MKIQGLFWRSGLFVRNWVMVGLSILILYFFLELALGNESYAVLFCFWAYLTWVAWSIRRSIHPRRRHYLRRFTPDRFGLEYEQVTFLSRDGTQLSGWFIPGHTRRVVVLVHGLEGSGILMAKHARLFSTVGYSVFLPDLRAHGNSAGDTVTVESAADDILDGIDFLKKHADVDMDHICALGISFGGLAVLRAACKSKVIRSIVLESIGPMTLADLGGRPKTLCRWVNYPFNWLQYQIYLWMCGFDDKEGVVDSLRLIYPRSVLFISTGLGKEQYFMRLFYETARQPKSIWEIPHASHGNAYEIRPLEYRQRVMQVFDKTLST